VIGEYPILLAGGEAYEYCSYASIDTSIYVDQEAKLIGEQNYMEGYFRYQEICEGANGRRIRVTIPRFYLEFPDVIL
jgi:uncharacterized protein affecting Mg2+/Co2+ transport